MRGGFDHGHKEKFDLENGGRHAKIVEPLYIGYRARMGILVRGGRGIDQGR
jgi:hypothetical protein